MVEKETAGNKLNIDDSLKKSQTSMDERRKEKQVKEVEVKIEQLEAYLANLALKLEHPPQDAVKVQKLGTEYVKVQKELEMLMDRWGSLHE